MNEFERLNKALEIIEDMKKNILEMMEIDVKTRLILANPKLQGDRNGDTRNPDQSEIIG